MTTKEKTAEQVIAKTRSDRLQGMQEMIDFLARNLEVPLPYFSIHNSFAREEESVSDIARAMKPVTKATDDNFFSLTREFVGNVRLQVNWSRSAVCERVVVGTKEVDEYIIEAHTEDIVEWICPDGILEHDDR